MKKPALDEFAFLPQDEWFKMISAEGFACALWTAKHKAKYRKIGLEGVLEAIQTKHKSDPNSAAKFLKLTKKYTCNHLAGGGWRWFDRGRRLALLELMRTKGGDAEVDEFIHANLRD